MPHKNETIRLTVGQAIIRFLVNQYSERDGKRERLVAGALGIFGHGNVAGLGQALLQNELDPTPDGGAMPYIMPRNEQGMVHTATAFAKTRNRMQTMMCTASIGPGSLNMVTGAATATTNRLPVLIFPSDEFASRRPDPVLQQVENFHTLASTATDAFRPVSAFFDRIERPEQLPSALLHGLQVLTDPATTGAVVIALPQDVQAEAYDWPVKMFGERTWYVRRPKADDDGLRRAAAAIKKAERPIVLAGGGVIYSSASEQLRHFAAKTGIPVADTQAGKGAINFDHPQSVGGLGATGAASANAIARDADLVIGIGTRYSDFTTASNTQFQNPDVKFLNVNVQPFDAIKQGAEMVVADAKETLVSLSDLVGDYHVDEAYSLRIAELRAEWAKQVDRAYNLGHGPLPAQTEIFGVLNALMGDDDILINAAGSMPGDLQALWQAKTPEQYHLEYAFSCMGYEIPASLGAKLGAPESEVVAIVGDGTYQMLPMEIATIVQEGVKVILVLLQNRGFASIGALSESLGSQRFGTHYRKNEGSHVGPGDFVPGVDIAANARSWGMDVVEVDTVDQFEAAFKVAQASPTSTMIYVETDINGPNPPSSSWWEVPVSEVSRIDSTSAAYGEYVENRRSQRLHI